MQQSFCIGADGSEGLDASHITAGDRKRRKRDCETERERKRTKTKTEVEKHIERKQERETAKSVEEKAMGLSCVSVFCAPPLINNLVKLSSCDLCAQEGAQDQPVTHTRSCLHCAFIL